MSILASLVLWTWTWTFHLDVGCLPAVHLLVIYDQLVFGGGDCHVADIAQAVSENRGDLYSTAPADDGRNAADALLN